MKKGLTVKQKKIILGLAIAGITIPPTAYLIWYLSQLPPPSPDCTDGETKCINSDLYTCSNGQWGIVQQNSPQCTATPVECSSLDENSCKSSLNCRWCRTDFVTPPSCLSVEEYPYKCVTCGICFRTQNEKNSHDETYHPTTHFEYISTGWVRGKQVFDLGQERYVGTIAGDITADDCPDWWCVLCYTEVWIEVSRDNITWSKVWTPGSQWGGRNEKLGVQVGIGDVIRFVRINSDKPDWSNCGGRYKVNLTFTLGLI